LEAWQRYALTGPQIGTGADIPARLRPEIMASWDRSAGRVSVEVAEAPLADLQDVRSTWESSPLRTAVRRIEPQLRLAAEDAGLVVAVTDPGRRILWTCTGPVMRRRAEAVNFVPGGRWDESSVGTNALDLALRLDSAATVYSAEHFSSCVHDWSCWAAPIHDPATGRQLGVVDLSTSWDRAHPMGLTTAAAFAHLLEQALPVSGTRPGVAPADAAAPGGLLELRLLGGAEAELDGVPLLLARRQLEILALLALNPRGLSVDALHAQLYGDRQVSRATLKSEVSHLRTVLGGRLASRPYRLTLRVRCDAVELLDQLHNGRLLDAASAYRGELLPGTEAPGLLEYGHYVAVAVREALLATPDAAAVARYAEAVPHDVEVLERAVRSLGDAAHPAGPLLRARLRTAYEL
jgi:transcriptional regulator of acetoin/glycerol metabolism